MNQPKPIPEAVDCQIVTVYATETEQQRKDREKRGEVLPAFSYAACRAANA